jgi:hypothetical protein
LHRAVRNHKFQETRKETARVENSIAAIPTLSVRASGLSEKFVIFEGRWHLSKQLQQPWAAGLLAGSDLQTE